jgi:hypothetical protein
MRTELYILTTQRYRFLKIIRNAFIVHRLCRNYRHATHHHVDVNYSCMSVCILVPRYLQMDYVPLTCKQQFSKYISREFSNPT